MSRRAVLWSVVLPDIILVAAWLWILIESPVGGRIRVALLAAIPFLLIYGIVSVQYPSEVLMDEAGVTFRGWGLEHRFSWADVAGSVKVRGFLVKDRVFVRIGGFHPWRGRYWLTDKLGGWTELLEELRRRAAG